jgi:hypothetical protein
MMLARVGKTQAHTSTKFTQATGMSNKKSHTRVPSGGFTMEACVIADGSNCTAFVSKIRV